MSDSAVPAHLRRVVSRLSEGKIVSLSDLISEVAPPPPPAEVPATIPLPAVITDGEREALERLPELYGSVVPTEKRRLEPEESAALREERDVIDTVAKMVGQRKTDIALTISNHIDCVLEDEGEVPEGAERNDNGNYIVARRVSAGDGKEWSREVRKGTTNIDPAVLQALADDPDSPFTHADYLAMTEQVRVIEENKFMLHLKKNPHLLDVVRQATTAGQPTAAIYLRNAKRGR